MKILKCYKLLPFYVLLLQISTLTAQTPAASSYNDGDGSISDPYQITNIAELRRLSETTSDWGMNFILMNNIDATETNTWNIGDHDDDPLTPDVATGFSPIGNPTNNFTGNFNGNGYEINNLFINQPTLNDLGFFGKTSYATISNIKLINIKLTGHPSYSGIGGLIGVCSTTSVSRCSVKGDIISGGCGMLVGFADWSSTINECYTTGSVSGRSAGGLVGEIDAATISNCYSECTVTDGMPVGGLIGKIWLGGSHLSKNYATGYTKCASGFVGDEGGLVGSNEEDGIISDCFYDIQTTGRPKGISTDKNDQTVIALNTEDFNDKNNFTNWDFTNIWIIAKTDVFRPRLRWEEIYRIAYTPSLNGTVEGKTYQYVVADYNSESVMANPDSAYHLVEWQNEFGDSITNENPLVLSKVKDHYTLKPIFDINSYNISFQSAPASGGRISGDTLQLIVHGNNATQVEAIANEHYHFVEWQNTVGDSITNVNPLPVNIVVSDSHLVAVYALDSYEVNIESGINGAVSGDLNQMIKHGSNSIEVEAIPNSNYSFTKWQNTAGDSITNENPLIISNVICDTSLTAVFDLKYYSLFFETNGNGSIAGQQSQSIQHGSNALQVEAIPDDNYHFVKWISATNDSITDNNPLLVTNVIRDSSLLAVFEIDTYNVSLSAGENGELSGESNQIIAYDSYSVPVEAIANEGYSFTKWVNNYGDSITNGNPLSINVTSDTSLTAVFSINKYEIQIYAAENGIILGESNQIVNHGSNSETVNAQASVGYSFVEWQDSKGAFVSSDNPLTISNVVSDTLLTAIFEINSYNVYFNISDNGSILGSELQIILHGENTEEVTAIPDLGYTFINWQDSNGNLISTNNPLIVTNVVNDSTLFAVFEYSSLVKNLKTSNIDIYPNPTNGLITIEGDNIEYIELISSTGAKLEQIFLNDNNFQLDLGQYAGGLFFVKVIERDGNKQLTKIVKTVH